MIKLNEKDFELIFSSISKNKDLTEERKKISIQKLKDYQFQRIEREKIERIEKKYFRCLTLDQFKTCLMLVKRHKVRAWKYEAEQIEKLASDLRKIISMIEKEI